MLKCLMAHASDTHDFSSLLQDSNAAWEDFDGDTGSPDDESDAAMPNVPAEEDAAPVGIKLTLSEGSGKGRALRLSRAQTALLLPQMLALSEDAASMPCKIVDVTGAPPVRESQEGCMKL